MKPIDLVQGTLDLLILKSLVLEPQHGWAIAQRLHQISSATLQIRQGSLYPALHRLERQGWVKAAWKMSESNQRVREYRLTPPICGHRGHALIHVSRRMSRRNPTWRGSP